MGKNSIVILGGICLLGLGFYELLQHSSEVKSLDRPDETKQFSSYDLIIEELPKEKDWNLIAESTEEKAVTELVKQGVEKHKQGDERGAINNYDRAIDIEPSFALPYLYRANAKKNIAEYDEAIQDSTKAIELAPDRDYGYAERALVWTVMSKYDKALEDLNRAIELNPSFAPYYAKRSSIHLTLGKYREGLNDANKAIELDRNFEIAYKNRAILHYKLGNKLAAIDDYTKVISIDPREVNYYKDRSTIYLEIGEKEKGIADLRKSAELYKEREEHVYYQSAMTKLRKILEEKEEN